MIYWNPEVFNIQVYKMKFNKTKCHIPRTLLELSAIYTKKLISRFYRHAFYISESTQSLH